MHFLNFHDFVCSPKCCVDVFLGLPPEGRVNRPLLVATCHVHWDPEFCDVKLIQTMMLMHRLQTIIKEAQMSLRTENTEGSVDCNSIPLILCGDLNSLPDSGLHLIFFASILC